MHQYDPLGMDHGISGHWNGAMLLVCMRTRVTADQTIGRVLVEGDWWNQMWIKQLIIVFVN